MDGGPAFGWRGFQGPPRPSWGSPRALTPPTPAGACVYLEFCLGVGGAAHHWDSGNCFVDCVGVFVAGGQKVPALHVFQVRFSVFWVTTLNRFKITESPA